MENNKYFNTHCNIPLHLSNRFTTDHRKEILSE